MFVWYAPEEFEEIEKASINLKVVCGMPYRYGNFHRHGFYTGETYMNRPHGMGTFRSRNGKILEGEWFDGHLYIQKGSMSPIVPLQRKLSQDGSSSSSSSSNSLQQRRRQDLIVVPPERSRRRRAEDDDTAAPDHRRQSAAADSTTSECNPYVRKSTTSSIETSYTDRTSFSDPLPMIRRSNTTLEPIMEHVSTTRGLSFCLLLCLFYHDAHK